MAILDRDTIKAKNDRTLEKVTVKEWGGDIYFGSLPLGTRNRLLAGWTGLDQSEDVAAMSAVQVDLLIAVVCDENGKAVFTDDDREWLPEKDAGVISDLSERAMAFLGFTKDANEEAVGNSVSAPTSDTKSDSPEVSA